jgi:hypothetical protein
MSRMDAIRSAIVAGLPVEDGKLALPRLRVKNGYTTRRHQGEARHWQHAHLSVQDAAEEMGLTADAVRRARNRYGIPL